MMLLVLAASLSFAISCLAVGEQSALYLRNRMLLRSASNLQHRRAAAGALMSVVVAKGKELEQSFGLVFMFAAGGLMAAVTAGICFVGGFFNPFGSKFGLAIVLPAITMLCLLSGGFLTVAFLLGRKTFVKMNRRHSALAAEVEEIYTLALGRVRFVELSDEYLSKRVPNEGDPSVETLEQYMAVNDASHKNTQVLIGMGHPQAGALARVESDPEAATTSHERGRGHEHEDEHEDEDEHEHEDEFDVMFEMGEVHGLELEVVGGSEFIVAAIAATATADDNTDEESDAEPEESETSVSLLSADSHRHALHRHADPREAIKEGDQLVSVDGTPIEAGTGTSAAELSAALTSSLSKRPVALRFRPPRLVVEEGVAHNVDRRSGKLKRLWAYRAGRAYTVTILSTNQSVEVDGSQIRTLMGVVQAQALEFSQPWQWECAGTASKSELPIDFFVTHSWADDTNEGRRQNAGKKMDALLRVNQAFKHQFGRPVRVWYEKFCIPQVCQCFLCGAWYVNVFCAELGMSMFFVRSLVCQCFLCGAWYVNVFCAERGMSMFFVRSVVCLMFLRVVCAGRKH
jgi:hypothetical protein